MNARLYDPVLGRFLSPDPYVQLPDFSQNFNRYTYGLNNPLLYTDPSGEYALIDDILAAVIGGTVNLIGNAISGNVNSWGEGFAYFGWGALAGEATLYSGPVAGAGILSAGNSLTNQVSVGDWENVNANRLLFDTMLGMSTAYIGGQLSPIIAGPVGSVMSTFTSNEMVQMIATQTVTTALTGFMLGTGTSLLNGMSFEDALKVGMSSGLNGLVTGFTTSSIKAYLDLKSSWTKDRTYPNNLEEQLTLEEARNGQGREIMKGQTNDPEWYGWQKMQHIHKTPTGDNITIHFWKNPITGEVTGFKFKE